MDVLMNEEILTNIDFLVSEDLVLSVATGSEFPVPGIAIPGPGRVRVYP